MKVIPKFQKGGRSIYSPQTGQMEQVYVQPDRSNIPISGKEIKDKSWLERTLIKMSPYGRAMYGVSNFIYPYDYNPAVTFRPLNVRGYHEILDLDLNNPEDVVKMDSIRDQVEDGIPIFQNRSRAVSNSTLQRQFRERYDLMQLSAGKKQKYNSFTRIELPDGSNAYKFTNPEINNRYLSRAKNAKNKYGMSESGYVTATKDGVKYVPLDQTNALFNQYQIRGGTDEKGPWTQVYDVWDLAPIEWLPGAKKASPRIIIRDYDKNIRNTKEIEEFVVPNSVYHGNSIKISEKEKPEKEYESPMSFGYMWNALKGLFK